MKFLFCGDLHIRANRPKNRIDDYTTTLFGKLGFIYNLAKQHNAVIIKPGDIFDTPNTSYLLFRQVLELLKTHPRVLAVYGQHDLRYHTSFENNPLAALESAGVVDILGEEPIEYEQGKSFKNDDFVHVYGTSWGQTIPKIQSKEALNILAIHTMVVHNDLLWEGQTDYTRAHHLLMKNDFGIIVSGDNHNGFIAKTGNKLLVNCGSLMRATAAQTNHKPFVYLYDTDTRKGTEISVPIRPIEEVMDLNKVEEEKETDKRLEAFIKGLNSERENVGLDFAGNLRQFITENNVSDDVAAVIFSSLEEAGNEGKI